MVTDNNKPNVDAPVDPETSQKAESAEKPGADEPAPGTPEESGKPGADALQGDAAPGGDTTVPSKSQARRGRSKGANAPVKKDTRESPDTDGDEPATMDPAELISRLAERSDIVMELTEANEHLENEVKVLQDKVLRSAADFDNFRKRSRKEWDLLKQQSKADVILEFLQVVDDFERAFSVVGERDDDFVQGIRLIYNNLVATLEKIGAVRIEAHHTPFDPNYHMAIGQIESEDVESGHVVEVVQQGYRLDDTIIRPARVVIAK